jgi:hypothetical protein
VEGPLSVVATAQPAARGEEVQWDLSVTLLQPGAPGEPRRASVLVPRAYDAVPASATLSWTELDDATQRIWAPDLAVLVSPVVSRTRTLLSPLSVERLKGPCEGAAFVNGGTLGRVLPGSQVVVLIIPAESLALGALSDGAVSSIPLVQTLPGKVRGKKKAVALARVTSVLATDERIRLERVDVKLDPVTHRSVGGAWRVTLLPSRTVGQLTSTVVTFTAEGMALHQVSGGLMLKGGRGDVSGVLMEALP